MRRYPTGDIGITKQSVWETLKHNQPGIHSQLGILILAARQHCPLCLNTHTWYQLGKHINWGYTWTGDISISKQSVGEYTVNLEVKMLKLALTGATAENIFIWWPPDPVWLHLVIFILLAHYSERRNCDTVCVSWSQMWSLAKRCILYA